jgi:hypothetical protein
MCKRSVCSGFYPKYSLTLDSLIAREIEALQRCVHPNIVALITIEHTVNGNPIVILEWLKCTLEEHFERNKGFFTGSSYQAPARSYVVKKAP